MTISVMPMTAEEFDQYALLPENTDKILEILWGRFITRCHPIHMPRKFQHVS